MRIRDFWESLSLAVILALLIRLFFLSVYKIPSSSMAPTLWPGDFILASKVAYGVQLPFTNIRLAAKEPTRGDLIAFQWTDKAGTTYVKRVVGVAGDHILIKGSRLFVNEQELKLEEIENKWSQFPGMEYMRFYEEYDGNGKHTIMHTKELVAGSDLGPFVVPPGEVFVLGDNREASDDSRYWGMVPVANIEAKVLWIWLSIEVHEAKAKRWIPRLRTERMFQWLQ